MTAVIGAIKQSEIDKQYLSFQTAPLTPVQHHALVALPSLQQRIAYLAGPADSWSNQQRRKAARQAAERHGVRIGVVPVAGNVAEVTVGGGGGVRTRVKWQGWVQSET